MYDVFKLILGIVLVPSDEQTPATCVHQRCRYRAGIWDLGVAYGFWVVL